MDKIVIENLHERSTLIKVEHMFDDIIFSGITYRKPYAYGIEYIDHSGGESLSRGKIA